MSHKKSDLGQCLYKSRFGKSTKNIKINTRKPMKSMLEESDVQKIFSLGALVDKDFTAIRVINDKDREGMLSQIEKKMFDEVKSGYTKLLSVPRRPKGARLMSKEELLAAEKNNFYNWRRQLAEIEADKRVKLTPYELNLDFWRQLWRVIERSDILIQVVDARNPLLFRSEDLENYVKEVDKNKINIILINKADLLTEKQREIWASYFDSLNLRVIFWSAKIAEEKRKAEKLASINESENDNINEEIQSDLEKDQNQSEELCDNEISDVNVDSEDIPQSDDISEEKSVSNHDEMSDVNVESEDIPQSDDISEEKFVSNHDESDDDEKSDCQSEESFIMSDDSEVELADSDDESNEDKTALEEKIVIKNSSEMIGVDEIISLLESFNIKNPHEPGKITTGLVGYPNVGKSSTINAIFGRKKVSVSATPGHTKRFQTLNITDKLIFCDCPGLVMPSVVHSKGHLMVSGILPIDTIRDYIAPINIIAEQFPRETIELLYGIQLPEIRDNEDPSRPPTAREILSSYSYMHGMMTSKGNPNLDRAARIILKDYVDGRLLYRHPPPGMEPNEFESAAELPEEKKNKNKAKPPSCGKNRKPMILEPEIPLHSETIQSIKGPNYLKIKSSAMHDGMKRLTVNINNETCDSTESVASNAKPWRQNIKRGKKEKMRNKHSALDQHSYVYF